MAQSRRADGRGLVGALRDYVEARSAALTAARKGVGIGELDARALLFITENPGIRAGDLREYLGITSAGVTTLTDRLVERGAIRREADAADRRIVRLSTDIDMRSEPWSALSRFDDEIAQGIGDGSAADAATAAKIVADLTRRAAPDVSGSDPR